MLTTIKGIYDDGNIILEETPHVPSKTDVIVTFLEEENNPNLKKRKLGGLEGKVTLPIDFNEPLEDLKEYI